MSKIYYVGLNEVTTNPVSEQGCSSQYKVPVSLELQSSFVTVITGKETNPTKQRQRPRVRLEIDSVPHIGFIVPLTNPMAKAIGFFKQTCFDYKSNLSVLPLLISCKEEDLFLY